MQIVNLVKAEPLGIAFPGRACERVNDKVLLVTIKALSCNIVSNEAPPQHILAPQVYYKN